VTDRRCLTPEEYARERKVSVRTVYRLIKADKVPAERVGRQWRIWIGFHTTRQDTRANF